MDGIITLVLGFILGVVVAVTAMYRITAYWLKTDDKFSDAMHSLDETGEVSDCIVRFFYGDQKE